MSVLILCGVLIAICHPTGAAVDFAHDVIPLLSRLGCNGSACHGKAEGQNGFKLSVFANNPENDFLAIRKESRGRRVSATAPENSLLLRKISGEVGHGGGIRAAKGSAGYKLLRDWIKGGMPFSVDEKPKLVAIKLELP